MVPVEPLRLASQKPSDVAAGQSQKIITTAAVAPYRQGTGQMRMIASEEFRQRLEINTEAPGASSAISIHGVPMIEKVAERLNQHVKSTT